MARHLCLGINGSRIVPEEVQSGTVVGICYGGSVDEAWAPVATNFLGWQVIAGLGDNHAGGVGGGLCDDQTIVISAGSSGTVIRRCSPRAELVGKALKFEYYRYILLLTMLHKCADWYGKFAGWHWCGDPEKKQDSNNMRTMDREALEANPNTLRYWNQRRRDRILLDARGGQCSTVASAQFSLAIELLWRVRDMLVEVKDSRRGVDKIVLTGGISRSEFFQQVISAGIGILAPDAKVFVSDPEDPFANQAATAGAMINALVGSGVYPSLKAAIKDLCPMKPVEEIDATRWALLQEAIKRALEKV